LRFEKMASFCSNWRAYNHSAYHAMAPQSADLDAFIVSIGREHIPELLPGRETPN